MLKKGIILFSTGYLGTHDLYLSAFISSTMVDTTERGQKKKLARPSVHKNKVSDAKNSKV